MAFGQQPIRPVEDVEVIQESYEWAVTASVGPASAAALFAQKTERRRNVCGSMFSVMIRLDPLQNNPVRGQLPVQKHSEHRCSSAVCLG